MPTYDDWEEDDPEGLEDDEHGDAEGIEVEGPSYAPIFTGLVTTAGRPFVRHPIVLRPGFWPADRQYHAPTMEDDDDDRVVGWIYGEL